MFYFVFIIINIQLEELKHLTSKPVFHNFWYAYPQGYVKWSLGVSVEKNVMVDMIDRLKTRYKSPATTGISNSNIYIFHYKDQNN